MIIKKIIKLIYAIKFILRFLNLDYFLIKSILFK